MVGLVLVSHSHALAQATLTLVKAMTGEEVPIAIAAGTGEDFKELGTDAMEIYAAIESVAGDDGVLVLMDMGSAVLSAEMALDFLEESVKDKVKLCPSSFVEGAVAAGVASKIGSSLQEVYLEASNSLHQKESHITPEEVAPAPSITQLYNAKTIRVIIPNPHGLHARPVANLIQEASPYESKIQIRNLTNGKGPVSLRSMTGIIGLEALQGNEIELSAEGSDSDTALSYLKTEIEKGLGDSLEEDTPASIPAETSELSPVGISKGIVIGKLFYPQTQPLQIPKNKTSDPKSESNKLKLALEKTNQLLTQKNTQASKYISKEQQEIFKAQAIMLLDPELIDPAFELIRNHQYNAAQAWDESVQNSSKKYRSLTDTNLQQRALDLQDVSHMVLGQLGIPITGKLDIPEEGILLVEDITPGQVVELDPQKIKGVICMENGPTSHSSILLRSIGIPAIIQAKRFPTLLFELKASTLLAMDGETGIIVVNPTEKEILTIQEEKAKQEQQSLTEKEESHKPAVTTDGKVIDVFANVGRLEDALSAADNGAEGIGLFRTEFMFIEREQAPTEEEQIHTLQSILAPMKGKPIIIRTLDAGGDKEIPYLNIAKEENPFLGIRAIRLCLRNTELFQQQLRAILRISTDFDIRIMFPMISTLEELRQAKNELEKAHQSLVAENIAHTWPIPTGMMMEVPSAAIMAHAFVPEVDFISIGTNDLIQYTLAADRGNPELQETLGKGLNPAVISLIKHITQSAIHKGIPVAVCGESASNPELAAILLGLGVNELSMNGRSIPAIKQLIRSQSYTEMAKNADHLLSFPI